MSKELVKILWISDLHIGSIDCNAKVVLKVLKKYHFEKLIIVGDLSEGKKPNEEWQRRLVKYLKKYKEKIIYIEGNHDPAGNHISKFIGIQAIKSYACTIGSKNIFAIHGHQFNDFGDNLSDHLIDWLICKIMIIIKLIELKGINLGRIIIQLCAKLNALEVTRKAKEFANNNNYDTIICGHVHVPCHRIFRVKRENKKKRIDYFNCGCFLDGICTYLITYDNGTTKLCSI